MSDIRQWLEELGLGQYADAFEENDIDESLLPDLTDEALERLGVASMGHRMKLLKAFAAQSSPDLETAEATEPLTPEPSKPSVEAERRQITVMFCDLVGSTALSEKLDPEDLRALMQAYQKACGQVVERYDGHIAQYLGDGILVYFGWPHAHEHEAQRAVLAGLEMIESVKGLDVPVELAVRIGIATGLVVIGETGEGDASEPKTAVGETPNLAARLQSLASANAMVIGAVTKELAGDAFGYEDLGRHEVKGITEPVYAWGVLGESADQSDLEASSDRSAPFLVGRDEEIGLLHRAWHQSKEELGQAVLINGEPGIGKSALVETLLAQLHEEGLSRIVFRCSAFHTNSALYPVIEHVKRVMRRRPSDSPKANLSKLEQMLSGYNLPLEEVVPLFESLLSLSLPEDCYKPLDLSPEQLKQQTLDMIVAWLLEQSEQQATVMVWEDVQWADPSSLELLGLLLAQVPTATLLLVLTFRPDFTVTWPSRSHMIPITLNRLERTQTEAFVKHLAKNKSLPEEVVEHIVAKTDGVPLYVEELTKTILSSVVLRERDDRYELTGPLSAVAIPATLQESLMARLDQLPTVREVAQLGAVLGREFAYELLHALGLIKEPTLSDGLSRLVAEELLYQRGRPPRAKYIFKHALIQDAAYQSLLRRTRQKYHYQVAQLLEERFPEQVETEPEILAFHYTGAGRTVEAIEYWRRAGKRAVEQYANAEAIAHLSKGLELLQELPENADRARQELSLRIDLVACMRILDRHDEALETLDRAQVIATDLGRIEDLAVLHNYRGNIYFPLGRFDNCLEQHQLAADYARQAGAVEQEARALSGLGDAYYLQGQMIKSFDHFRQCVDFCREHALHSAEAKNSPMVAWIRQYLNDFAGAAKEAVVAIDAALTFGDRRAEVLARVAVASALTELGDIAGARTQIEAGLAVVETVGTLRFKPLFAILRNRVDLAEGKSQPQLVAAMEDAFQTARETGINFLGPWVLSSLALVSDDPERRRQALVDGEELLRAGCVGHNYLAFYPDAIEIALADAAWDEVERYAGALADYTRPEPLPLTDFYIAYGRTLAAFGRSVRDKATVHEIERLRDEATRAGLTRSIPRLDRALAEASLAAGSHA